MPSSRRPLLLGALLLAATSLASAPALGSVASTNCLHRIQPLQLPAPFFLNDPLRVLPGTTWMVVLTPKARYHYENGRLDEYPPFPHTGDVVDEATAGNESLLRLKNGSFYTYDYGHREFQFVKLPDTFTPVSRLMQQSDDILIAAAEGLFKLEGDKLVQAFAVTISQAFQLADSLLLVTPTGLIRYKDQKSEALGIFSTPLLDAVQVEEYLLLLTPNSLSSFRQDFVTLLNFTEPIESPRLRQADGHALLHFRQANSASLYHFRSGNLIKLESAPSPSKAVSLDDTVIIATGYSGVYELRGSTLSKIVPARVVEGILPFDIYSLFQSQELVFGWSRTIGLQRYSDHAFSNIFSWRPTGQVLHVAQVGDELLVLAREGLFRFVDAQGSVPVASPRKDIESLTSSEPHTIAIKVTHPCAAAFEKSNFEFVPSDEVTQQIWPKGVPLDVALDVDDEQTVTWYGSIELPEGTYRVKLAMFEGAQRVPISPPITFRVDWGFWEHIENASKVAAPWIIAGHTLLFLGLLAGARRSRWCWSVVSDPFWGKTGLWFYFALRHVGILQRWVMDRWFAEVRRKLVPVAYVPMPLCADDGQIVQWDDLPYHLQASPRVWIQGNAGMGKTVLVAALQQTIFGQCPTVFAARKRFGFVPIVVPLRRFADIAPDPKQPELYVADLARRAVAEHGPEFEDAALFRSILINGGFVVVLDGANEVPHSDQLESSSRRLNQLRVLITSQTKPAHAKSPQDPDGFDLLRLPSTIEHAVEPLLKQFLGEDRGPATYDQVKASPLLADIRSGYDVRLLADLVKDSKGLLELPPDRVGLYDAILAAVVLDGRPYPIEQLCEAAWLIWRDGKRRLIPDTHLAKHLCDPLLSEHTKVLRTLDGTAYEFRHDQMRGFLAARWAALHAVDPIHLFEEDETIWRVGRSDQEIVWGFFATMIEPHSGLRVWQWSTREPHRAVLQHALQQRGEREGWDLSVKLAPTQPD